LRNTLNECCRFSEENFPKILELVDKIGAVGKAHGATPGQTTLAWILAQGEDFFVIPGTKKEKVIDPQSFTGSELSDNRMQYLLENIGAAKVKLTPEEIAAVRKIAEEGDAIPGDRFQPGWREFAYTSNPPLNE